MSDVLSSVCSIYFPDVTPAFAKYCEQRDALHKVLAEHKDRYKSGMAGKEFFPPFHRGMLELISRSKELKKAAIAEAHKFAGADRLWPWKRRAR
ncbi:MAG TPA: hypothetical protein VFE89_06495 [Beijerinckiaceae bacterium]|nr:hypothetical protein [Beijerinckiaceae bacterium]